MVVCGVPWRMTDGASNPGKQANPIDRGAEDSGPGGPATIVADHVMAPFSILERAVLCRTMPIYAAQH
jgi:hypothetical protein